MIPVTSTLEAGAALRNTVGIAQNFESQNDLSEIVKHGVEVRKESLESLAGGGELEDHPEVSRMLANPESNLDV